jgi:hypothetical protein
MNLMNAGDIHPERAGIERVCAAIYAETKAHDSTQGIGGGESDLRDSFRRFGQVGL